ncbi:MAG: endo-beta-N-acetylglucosaminidase [Bacteroidaceae bacterium]|nr:endo-beta-N-acetylglucosaminidase [Bacteroidaceae bacterium]
MKKRYFAGFALALALLGTPAETTAQNLSETATQEIYDFSGFDVQKLLDLFYTVEQQGRKYPTMEEFESIGIQASDIAFVRSHVRRAEILDRSDRLRPQTYEKRNLFLNIPMDVGSGGAAGYPNDKFAADVFSMWQYTNLFGSWNHGFFQAPGAWVDAAHRNGTNIMSGIAFFESWTEGSGDGAYSALITQKVNGEFKYVRPLINCLMFFGADGINYNWEDNSYSNADIVAFHKALYKYAKEVGFNDYDSAIYTAVNGLATYNLSTANALLGNSEGQTHALMLNYSGGDFTSAYNMQQSVQVAEQTLGTTEDLYTGVWIVGMDRSWNNLDQGDAHRIGICLWGEHGQSRFFSYNVGDGAFDTQGNYQRLLERAMSGGNRNPLNRPAVTRANSGQINWEATAKLPYPLMNFAGIAEWIPERSAIQGDMHFRTHFTLGNGDRYFYKGKKSYAGSWYNMSSQDLVPTYRWLCLKSNTTDQVSSDIAVNYTHLDAYTGGSCIELTGAATATGTDIVLYKTSLKAADGAYAKLAVKTLKDIKATNLYLILKKKGSDAWLEYPYGDVAGNTWEEKKIDLSGVASGDVIERIGLRVKGDNNDYQLYVGKLELNDESTVTPANVKDVVAEVKKETKSSMAIKLHWNVEATAKTRADWGLVYNDEANIDHFEILMKMGEDGKTMKVGTTSQWASLVPNIDFESVNDVPYVGVRAVSTDLKTYSPIQWVKVDRAAQSALPEKEEEYGNYGISQMDDQCEGADIARKQRYVTSVTTTGATQNLNYSANGPVADGTQYAKALDHVLKVKQGQTVTMTIKCANFEDGLKWCFAGGWMDLNGSGDFDKPLPTERTAAEIADGKTTTDSEGERLFFAGTIRDETPSFQTSGITFSFKVPDNATPGPSRLRIVFSDAWFAGMFNPVGYHAKGFTIDFGVEIEGTNPGRVVVDTRDQGEAEEPESLDAETSVEQVAGEISTAEGIDGAIVINNADKAWIYTVDGKLVEFVKNPAQVAVAEGVYLVKMQNGNIIRSAKVVVK